MSDENKKLDSAMIGKMYVTNVTFQWVDGGCTYDYELKKNVRMEGHWDISATLGEDTSRYNGNKQSMNFRVEQGIGAKLVEVLLPVIMADASRKADELARESKAMIAAFGDRTIACITQNANNQEQE